MPGTIILSMLCLLMFILWGWSIRRQYKIIQVVEGFTAEERSVLTRQVLALLPLLFLPLLFALFLLSSSLTFSLSKFKLFIISVALITYPTFAYIAISSIKNRVSFARSKPVKGRQAIVTGIFSMIILILQTGFIFFIELLW
jgi:hypothetical protein